jgi:uncharacterized lipoprotein YmbA
MLLLIPLAACHTTSDSRYYTLSPSYPPGINPSGDKNWTLSAVTVPEMLNRPQMIFMSGLNKVRVLEYDRWAEPLDSMTYRILSENLAARLGINPSASASQTNEHRIAVAIEEFDADDTGNVSLKAIWTARIGQENTEITTRHIFQKSEKADASNIGSVVIAMSQLLGDLADTVANHLAQEPL